MLTALWFVLAGFILGFATSTIWEWYYFRGRRIDFGLQERVGELQDQLDEKDIQLQRTRERPLVHEIAPAAPPTTGEAAAAVPAFDDEEDDFEAPHIPPASPRPAPAHGPSLSIEEKIARMEAASASKRSQPASEEPIQQTRDESVHQTTSDHRPVQRPQPESELITLRRGPARSRYQPESQQSEDLIGTEVEEQVESVHPVPRQIDPSPQTESAQPQTLVTETHEQETAAGHDERRERDQADEVNRFWSDSDEEMDNYPDDLTKIKGIGRVYQQRLYAGGVCTWAELANAGKPRLEEVAQARASDDVSHWKRQARSLAKKHDRAGAVYTGPRPDPLDDLSGLKPSFMHILYRSGVCTFHDLSIKKAAELGPLFRNVPGVSRELFDDWIAQASDHIKGEAA